MLSFAFMTNSHTVVIGAGHAGLSVSKLLTDRGMSHVVLEQSRIVARWRDERWDSFTLLTPNWATWLPEWNYQGPDPLGFMGRDDIVDYFERYARSFGADVREGVKVTGLEPDSGGGFRLDTSAGPMQAQTVVVATGPFQEPKVPAWSNTLPAAIRQLHSSQYHCAADAPDGAVLVVGAGPSGQQIADDLRRAGRKVYLSVGRHRRVPRQYRGRDYYWWYELGGFYEKSAEDLPPNRPRGDGVAPVLTGHNGGHDLDLRELGAQGVTLLGRATGSAGGEISFKDDLFDSLSIGDRAYDDFAQWVEARLYRFEGMFDRAEPRTTFDDPPTPPTSVDVASAGFSTVIWATGFRPNFTSWIKANIFDDAGFPVHRRGVTSVPGLFFIGLPWLHRLRSPFIRGAEEDARFLVSQVAATAATAETA